MKRQLLFTLLLFYLHSDISAQIKIDKQYYVDLLNQGRYDLVYAGMDSLQKQPYGKCCITDYFIAKSLCLSGLFNPAKSRFQDMLTNYKLSENARRFLAEESGSCNSSADVSVEESFDYINNFTLPTSSVRGKLGVVYNCFQSYVPVKIIKEIPAKELSSRLFSLQESQQALSKITSILPENYSAEAKGSFILVTSLKQQLSLEEKNQIINELEKTLQFYSKFYQLRRPDKILTAYILPDNITLQNMAVAVHGVQIPKENYGYSVLGDLSLLGISNAIGTGTLKHELFHLVVRTDIGDIPAWLDEGIATLYEESHWNGMILESNPGFWRTRTLQETLNDFHLYTKLPDLETMINYSWSKFDGTEDGDICMAAVNYAFAKHFAVYLEQTGQLTNVLNAYKNKIKDNKTDEIKTNAEIFVQATNRPVFETEKLFDDWLKATYNLSFLYPNLHGFGEVNALPDLRNNLRQGKIICDSLRKAINPKALALHNLIDETEDSINIMNHESEISLQNKNHGSPGEGDMYEIFLAYSKQAASLNQKLKKALAPYRKK